MLQYGDQCKGIVSGCRISIIKKKFYWSIDSGRESVVNEFFEHPILNSPYEYPARYWELDDSGQPTQQIIESRRKAEFITPIPKPKKQKAAEI